MKNFRGPFYERTATAPVGGVTGGTPVMIGNMFGIPVADAAEGELFTMILAGRCILAKATGFSSTDGGSIFFDPSTVKVTNDNTKIPIGFSTEAVGSDVEEVEVVFFPNNVSDAELTGKADKVSSATNDHLATLDVNGNLKDSGIAKTAIAAAQGDATTALANAATADGKAVTADGKAVTADGKAVAAQEAIAAHIEDTSAAHAASAISLTAITHTTATDVQGGIADAIARIYALEQAGS